jgi:hypothetical protein
VKEHSTKEQTLSPINLEDYRLLSPTFTDESMEKIEKVARMLGGGATSETALHEILRRGAQQCGLKMPDNLPLASTNAPHSDGRRIRERVVRVLLPKEWLQALQKKRPYPTEMELIKTLVKEFDIRIPLPKRQSPP